MARTVGSLCVGAVCGLGQPGDLAAGAALRNHAFGGGPAECSFGRAELLYEGSAARFDLGSKRLHDPAGSGADRAVALAAFYVLAGALLCRLMTGQTTSDGVEGRAT